MVRCVSGYGLVLSFCLVLSGRLYAQDAGKLFNKGYHFLSIDNNQAIKYLSESIDLDPSNAEAWYFRGIAKYKEDYFREALDDFDHAMKLDNHWALVNIFKGFCYRKMKLYDSALYHFTSYIEEYPEDTSAYSYVLRGRLRFETGDIEGSLEDFHMAVDLKPIEEKYHYYKFVAHYDAGDHKGALKQINEAIALAPDFYGYYFNRGNTYFELKNYEMAIRDYNYLIGLDVTNAEAYYQKGRAEHARKNFNQAIDDYSTAIAYNDSDGTYYFYRGHAKMDSGNKSGACADWYEAGTLGYYEDFDKIKAICK